MVEHIWKDRTDIPEDVKKHLDIIIKLLNDFIYASPSEIVKECRYMLRFYGIEDGEN